MAQKKSDTPLDYCDGCRRTHALTVCGLCPNCSSRIITDRRKRFPRSEGAVYMRRTFGRAFRNSLSIESPHARAR